MTKETYKAANSNRIRYNEILVRYEKMQSIVKRMSNNQCPKLLYNDELGTEQIYISDKDLTEFLTDIMERHKKKLDKLDKKFSEL